MTLKYPPSRNRCFGRHLALGLCLFFGLSAAAFGQGNQPPIVNAGPAQAIALSDAANLNGSATDDGFPNPPGALTYSWTVVSGPGTVTFANANAASTTANAALALTLEVRPMRSITFISRSTAMEKSLPALRLRKTAIPQPKLE